MMAGRPQPRLDRKQWGMQPRVIRGVAELGRYLGIADSGKLSTQQVYGFTASSRSSLSSLRLLAATFSKISPESARITAAPVAAS